MKNSECFLPLNSSGPEIGSKTYSTAGNTARQFCILHSEFLISLPPQGILRNRVCSSLAEGIAPQEAPYGQGQAYEDAPFHDGFDAVLGTGGGKAAGRLALQGGEKLPVQVHRDKNNPTYTFV